MDNELLSILVCPLCKVSLEQHGDEGFFCPRCRRLYPLKDNIPIMFIEDAKILPEEKQ
ncbi:MAG TPA: Trm112 family protein [Candidatus Limnocylindrales bacterium]|nr:Trm112 family protein [Candidatus Limnocylindrales bacterium]